MKRRIASSFGGAMAMGVMAGTANTVMVTKFNQSYARPSRKEASWRAHDAATAAEKAAMRFFKVVVEVR